MNYPTFPISPDAATAAYVRHEQTMITSSNVDETRAMVLESITYRINDVHAPESHDDLMACPICGRETGGPKYCGKCS